jgi:hypothetical protein
MNCPHCGKEINIGFLMGSVSSKRKARASRANGKLGGRPRKKKRPSDSNALAHSVVKDAEAITQRASVHQPPKG